MTIRTAARRPAGRRRFPFAAALAAAALAFLAAGLAGGAAQAQTEVPSNWPLIPSGLGVGDEFRLLFITSTTRDATSTDISDYNSFVQARAAAGYGAIRSFSSGFMVVGSTASVDARDNTSTTYTSSDKGVPIYWLNGNKLADDYEDFYDGSWDDEANQRNESGVSLSINFVFTGTNHDGTKTTRPLGHTGVTVGALDSTGVNEGPLSGLVPVTAGSLRRFYGLSGVFRVGTATNDPPTAANGTVTTGAGTAYAFAASDFNFSDTDGDTLAGVTITTLPASGKGTLAFGGTAVTLNQAVTKADIDADKLTYTPPAGASGTGYASFGFKVNDGTIDSRAAYTMTVNVTEAPAITRVAVTSTPAAAADTYGAGETIRFTVTFDSAVEVSASRPHVVFSLGGTGTEAAYERGSASAALVFAYTVQAGDADTDGISVGANAVRLGADGYIRGLGGGPAAGLSHDAPGTLSGHKVDGSQTPTVQLGAANVSVATAMSSRYTFDAGDFRFSGSGATLGGVRIVTLPASSRGTLRLGGRAVTADQIVPVADIDGGRLTYTPPPRVHGAAYASFTFRVRDSSTTANESASAYTMTVDVVEPAVPVLADALALRGRPVAGWTVVAVTPHVYGMSGNHATPFELGNYRWYRQTGDADPVRIRARHPEATGRTWAGGSGYWLTEADVGSRIIAELSFTDEYGVERTLRSAPFPETGTVRADGAAPASPELSWLKLDWARLRPAFRPDRRDYEVVVPSSFPDRTTVRAVGGDGASVSVRPVDSRSQADGHQVDIGDDTTAIAITATAGSATSTYTVTVFRLPKITLEYDRKEIDENGGAARFTARAAGPMPRAHSLVVAHSAVSPAADPGQLRLDRDDPGYASSSVKPPAVLRFARGATQSAGSVLLRADAEKNDDVCGEKKRKFFVFLSNRLEVPGSEPWFNLHSIRVPGYSTGDNNSIYRRVFGFRSGFPSGGTRKVLDNDAIEFVVNDDDCPAGQSGEQQGPAELSGFPELWSGRVTVGTWPGRAGYAAGRGGGLDDGGFVFQGSSRRRIDGIYLAAGTGADPAGTLRVSFAESLPVSFIGAVALEVGGRAFPFRSSSYDGADYGWPNPGLAWSGGDVVPVRLVVTRPALRSAGAMFDGTSVRLGFWRELDTGTLPPASAFGVEAGGVARAVGGVTGLPLSIHLTGISPPIGAGQAVTVSYADPTTGDDTAAVIQALDGADAPSFLRFPAANLSTLAVDEDAGAGRLTGALLEAPAAHGGAAFTLELAFSEAVAATAAALREHALEVSGAVVSAVEPVEAASGRRWRVTLTPSGVDTVAVLLRAATDCAAPGAVCTADGRGLAEAVEAEVPWAVPTRVTGAAVTSGPGENGTWDAGEHVDAVLRFNAAVTVNGPPTGGPTLAILLDGERREAAWTGGSGTAALTFRHTVTAADAGARTARVAANGLTLGEFVLGDNLGQEAATAFAVAPWVTGVSLAADASGDRSWTAGETVEVRLTFSEAVTVAGGTPQIAIAAAGGAAATLDYAVGSGSATLVFSRTLAEGDAALSGIAVSADSLELEGATLVAAASGLAAELGHPGTAPTEAPAAAGADALTAAFLDLPESHDGSATFTVRLSLSAEPTEGFSFKVFAGDERAEPPRPSVLEVTNGKVAGARRLEPDAEEENRHWEIAVKPEGDGAVTVRLPATTDCAAQNAICTGDGTMLAQAVEASVPGPAGAPEEETVTTSSTPFTVSWVNAPSEHDGATPFTFSFEFSERPRDGYSFETVRDHLLDVTQGGTRLTPKVRRTTPTGDDRNRGWTVTVAPPVDSDGDATAASRGDIRIGMLADTGCSATTTTCTGDGRPLSAALPARTVQGPPGLAVADARVDEAAGAAVEFAVTMSRAAAATVTVDYATADGTATAGADYTETSGTLSFAPGETAKTVPVPVLDDAHDEGEETFTLTLSNPTGNHAWLKDAEAVGTIANDDAMPRAWLARFGRTVAEQVVEAVEGRFSASRAAGVNMTLAGERIGWSGAGSGADGPEPGAGDARANAAAEAEARSRLAAMTAWLKGTEAADGEGRRAGDGSRAVTPRELLTGSSFSLTGAAAAGDTVSLWGRGAVSRFDGREPGAGGAGDLTLDGEVTSVMLGADWVRARWTAGLLVSRSVGEGGWRGASAGTVEGTLTGLYPYGRYLANDRVTLWGIAGYGAGELVLTPEDRDPMRTDMDLAMGALGLRGVALEAPAAGGVELAVKTDAMAVRTTSEKVDGMEAAEATVTRLRLGLEGTWRGLEAGGGELVPRLEVGVRHDGGDAETGFGLDLGGGLAWTHAASGLSAELRGRGLLTHESRGFRDRGLSGSFAWAPGEDPGRGPSLTLTQTMGASAAGGAEALLGQRHLAGLAADDGVNELANRRLELRLGYGFGVMKDRFTLTPEFGLGLAEGSRDYRLGWLLGLARGGAGALELTLEATRGEPVGANDNIAPEHGVRFGLTARW